MRLPLLLAALFAAAGCASTADLDDDYGFDRYDTDRDGYVSDSEFYDGFAASPYYADYDLDNDGLLSDDEFGATGFGYDYGAFDADRDGYLSDTEFYDGVYGQYDTDRDGRLTEDEFNVGYGATFGV